MKKLSNSELALLSLIMEEPRHAYQIEQIIEERNMRYWAEIGFSSIYRLLSGLEKSGLIVGELQPPEGRGPARKVYHLTQEGEEAWQGASLLTLAQPKRTYSSFLLGLDNLCALPPNEAQEAIAENLSHHQSVHEQLKQGVENHPQKDDFFIGIFFDYLLNQLETEITWLGGLTKKLEEHYKNV
jgi:DNA-binding PadR family transcriptional regulator